jgi:hypothetical protein
MDVSGYYSGQLNSSNGIVPYSRDYVGSIKLIEDSGFIPFKNKKPLNSTLNQIFEEFRDKTGFDVDVQELKDEFLDKNPKTRSAMNLYNSLASTFSNDVDNPSAIEDFLNEKIDEYVSAKDTNGDKALTSSETDLNTTLFTEIDSNKDDNIDINEIKSNFYDKFNSLKNILNYFKANPGNLIDTYA